MSRYCALAILACLLASFVITAESRPGGQLVDDYSAYEDDDISGEMPLSSTTSTTTTPRPRRQHFVKYRVPGDGDCWRKTTGGGAFRYVKFPCYFCPKGSIISGSGDCWRKGVGFRLLN